MTRLSATATIAALLLLAIAQGFGATKSTAKIASKGTAKPYHITARNQFHAKSPKHAVKAMTARQTEEQRHSQVRTQEMQKHTRNSHFADPLAAVGRSGGQRTFAPVRASKVRKHQVNPPTGKIGFVAATQLPVGGEYPYSVQSGTLNGQASFLTLVEVGGGVCSYSEISANGDGTFNAPAAVLTPTASGSCGVNFIVADLDGDGNTDIVEASGSGTVYVLLSNGDGTFTPLAPFTATANDIDGGTFVTDAVSGFLDLVIVDDAVPSNVITFPGNGDGTFAAALTPVPLVPSGSAQGEGYNVMLADFDGDGLTDVAMNDGDTGQLNVYLAAGGYAGVASATTDNVYNDICSATFGALVADGLPAIVETNCYYNTITVYNNTAGAFGSGTYYPVAVTPNTTAQVVPYAATIADVNGDGAGDVVVTNYYASDVTVLLGNGDGTLQVPAGGSVGYAVGGEPFTPAIVMDLNGDGLADILITDYNQNLVWMAGFGDGTFQAARDFYSPGTGDYSYSNSIASGDFNGDGITDLVVANYGNTIGLTVFLSNPDGSMQPGVNYGSGGNYGYVTVSDFNGDGIWDIAASDNSGSVTIFTGTGNGNFIQGSSYSTVGDANGVTAGAFNTTTGTPGFNDLAVVGDESSLVILLNNGIGGFTASAPISITDGGCALATADLNGDTFLDLAVSECEGSQIGILLGAGDGTFAAAPDVPLGDYPYGIALADIDLDGIPDIVTTAGSQSIALAIGVGDGTFGTATSMPSSLVTSYLTPFYNPYPSEVQVTDVDGDGFPDVVYVNEDYSTAGILFGTGTGSLTSAYFFDPVEFPTGSYARGVTVADVNGDGVPDAATANDDVAGVSVLINGNGDAALPNYSLSASTSFLNISAGGTGSLTVTVTPINFYNGTITFSCGGVPLGVTCAFAPATVTPVGNMPLSTTLTITTLAPHGALRMPADTNPHQGRTSLVACLTGMGLFGMLLAGDWKNKRNRRMGIVLGIMVLGMMFSLVGCSSSSKPGTPIGAQNIAVTAAGSDGTTQGINIVVNVF